MAKPRPVEGIAEDDPFASVAARVVSIRGRELADHAAGVLDTGDIERVHDMRVATRRLRAALEIFRPCFPKRPYKAALREVKELADALGERRDRDVTIAALEQFETELTKLDRPGVESLVGTLRDEQDEANRELAPHVTEQRVTALVASLEELAQAAADRVAPAPAGSPAASNGSVPR